MTKSNRISQKKPALVRIPFHRHLQELRTRLLWILLFFFLSCSIGYLLYDEIIVILLRPLNTSLFYFSPAGGLEFVIKVCVFFGMLLAIPFFLYQMMQFLSPLIPRYSRRLIILFAAAASFLLACGVLFAYFISLPAALHFLQTFTSDQIRPLLSAQDYFTFVTTYLLGFGIIFQVPLLLIFLNRIRPLQPKKLMHYQRYVILLSFICAAIITPTPDVINQLMLALPLIVLYQIGIVCIWFINKRNTSE